MNSWLTALREWNTKKGGKYTVPRKGTNEHGEVLALAGQHTNKATEVKNEKKAAKKAATAAAREARMKAKKEAAALAREKRKAMRV